MNNISKYIIEKLSLNKNLKTHEIRENCQLLIEFLQLKDTNLIDSIIDWFEKYHVIDISVQANQKTLLGFKNNISIKWNGEINQELFKGESFLCTCDDGNFDIMKWIINGSHDYSKLSNILLYSSKKDKMNVYSSKYGLYIEHEDYEALVLKKNKDEEK